MPGLYGAKIKTISKVKKMRRMVEMSQRDLAKASGVNIGYISRIERNMSPNIGYATALRIAEALGMAVTDVFEVEEVTNDE